MRFFLTLALACVCGCSTAPPAEDTPPPAAIAAADTTKLEAMIERLTALVTLIACTVTGAGCTGRYSVMPGDGRETVGGAVELARDALEDAKQLTIALSQTQHKGEHRQASQMAQTIAKLKDQLEILMRQLRVIAGIGGAPTQTQPGGDIGATAIDVTAEALAKMLDELRGKKDEE